MRHRCDCTPGVPVDGNVPLTMFPQKDFIWRRYKCTLDKECARSRCSWQIKSKTLTKRCRRRSTQR